MLALFTVTEWLAQATYKGEVSLVQILESSYSEAHPRPWQWLFPACIISWHGAMVGVCTRSREWSYFHPGAERTERTRVFLFYSLWRAQRVTQNYRGAVQAVSWPQWPKTFSLCPTIQRYLVIAFMDEASEGGSHIQMIASYLFGYISKLRSLENEENLKVLYINFVGQYLQMFGSTPKRRVGIWEQRHSIILVQRVSHMT